jgi:DNA-binding NarL/FixJ family response regulator
MDESAECGEAGANEGGMVIKAMLVEDSEIVREVLRHYLFDMPGLALAGICRCAPTAIDAIRRDPPDVVVLDIHLHEGNGMDVMRVVAAEFPAIKVIVVTNHADEIFRRRFIDAGAYGFHDKSRDLHLLRSSLEGLVAQSRT